MKNVGVVFGCLLMGACATGPDRATEMNAERARVRLYCAALFRDATLDPIRTKVAVDNENETTVQMLADKSKPIDSDRAVLLIWAKKKEDCWREVLSSMKRFSPPIEPQLIALDEAMYRRFQLLIADIYSQSLTYGEFARKRRELAAERREKVEELRQARARRSEQERAASQRQWEIEQQREKQREHEREVACIQAGGTWYGYSCAPGSQEIRIVR